jgi:hypothetical protein
MGHEELLGATTVPLRERAYVARGADVLEVVHCEGAAANVRSDRQVAEVAGRLAEVGIHDLDDLVPPDLPDVGGES